MLCRLIRWERCSYSLLSSSTAHGCRGSCVQTAGLLTKSLTDMCFWAEACRAPHIRTNYSPSFPELFHPWDCAWLNDPADTSSATQGRAGFLILSAVHISAISECGSMPAGFLQLHIIQLTVRIKDSMGCQSETISKEIPSVMTPTTQPRAEWEEMDWVGVESPELTELWERS